MNSFKDKRRIPVPPKAVLKRLCNTEGKTAQNVADIYGCSYPTAAKWLRGYGIKLQKSGKLPIPPKAELVTLYVINKMSSTDIALLYGCSFATVLKWLRNYDVPIRSRYEYRPVTRKTSTTKKRRPIVRKRIMRPVKRSLEHQYVTKDLPACDVAEWYGCSVMNVFNWLHDYNMSIREDEHKEIVELLKRLFVEEGNTATQIADMYKCSRADVLKLLLDNDISPYTKSRSTCGMIRAHNKMLADDPNSLDIKKMLGVEC